MELRLGLQWADVRDGDFRRRQVSGGGVNVLRCVAAGTKQFVDNFDKQDDDDDAVVMRRLDV